MLIHMVTDNFSTGGGLEHIFQVVRGMPAHDFRIFAKAGDALEKFSGLPNVETCSRGFSPKLVLKPKPDLVHIHHLLPLLAFYRNPLARYDVPVIYTAHGLHIHKYEFLHGVLDRLKYQLRFALEKHLFARVDQVIAVSRADRDFIAASYRSNHVLCIPNGIDPAGMEKAAPEKEFAAGQRLPGRGFLFITVARFNFQKGYDVLLRAIALARGILEEKNARFLLVGDGETLAAMKKMAERLQINGLVSFPGTRTDVYGLMKSADALVLPSRWEGLPIALLEAGLLKLPVIASDTFGNNELLAEGRGVLFRNENSRDLADKLEKTVRGEFELARRAESFHQTVKSDYSVAKMLAGLQDAYFSTHGGTSGTRKN